MMKIEIGQTIAGLRRARGITQEELAGAVGVSAPAVSKWETGQSYPDITLLPPLARFFGISVDALLAYAPQLSDEERDAAAQKLDAVFAGEGWDAGIAACEGLLLEYPDDMALRMLAVGAVSQGIVFAGDAQAKAAGKALQVRWLEEAAARSTGQMQGMAKNMLATFLLGQDRLEEAERIFEELLPMDQEVRVAMPTLRMRQGRNDEAKKLAQRNLVHAVQEIITTLTTLTALASQAGRLEEAKRCAQAARAVTECFDVASYFGAMTTGMQLQVADAAGDQEALVDGAEWYVQSVLENPGFGDSIFFDTLGITGKPFSPEQLAAMRTRMLEDFASKKHYDAVRAHPRFVALLDSLRA